MNIKNIVFTLVLLLVAPLANAEQLIGLVVGVSDGDTIKVLDTGKVEYKIRLTGIDAPEKKQPFGQRSKQHLSDLTYKKEVRVVFFKKDRYGRLLGKVLVDDKDVNLKQLKAGMAWVYVKYIKEIPVIDQEQYLKAEQGAKTASVGLWQDKNPIPPWEFRKK